MIGQSQSMGVGAATGQSREAHRTFTNAKIQRTFEKRRATGNLVKDKSMKLRQSVESRLKPLEAEEIIRSSAHIASNYHHKAVYDCKQMQVSLDSIISQFQSLD